MFVDHDIEKVVELLNRDREKGEMKMSPYQLDKLLSDYHWMVSTIKELKNELQEIAASTAQYGIEASMPKANSVSDPIFNEYLRREKHIKRIKKYEQNISIVQSLVDKIQGDREAEVLFWILEGRSMRWIGKHMGLSHVAIANIKTSIIEKMLEEDTAA